MIKRLYIAIASRLGFAHQSLRRTLLGILVLTLLVILVLFLVAAVYFVRVTEKNTWESRQQDTALSAASTLNNFMRVVQNDLVVVGSIDQKYLAFHPELLESVLANEPALLEIVCVDAEARPYASAYQDSAILASTFTIPQSSWYTSALQGETYIGRVEVSAENHPYIILAMPSGQGGVVAGRLKMDVLWDLVGDIRLGRTGQAYVVDKFGDVVAHQNADFVLGRVSLIDRMEFMTGSQSFAERFQGQYLNFEGYRVLGTAFPVFEGRWIMFVEVRLTEVFALTLSAITFLGLGLLLLTVLVGVGANRVMESKIFQPMKALRFGVERIGRGQLSHRINVGRRDELAEVADAFNIMAYRLQQRELALQEARDQALEATHFKSQLLAHVSHDLRTPLGVIIGHAEMWDEGLYGPTNSEQKASIERILANANRLSILVTTLLDEAQLEAGRFKLTNAPFDSQRLLEGFKSTLVPIAEGKGLTLTVSMEAGFPARLVGDLPRLQQIIFNLVDNAIKFTAQGGITVRFFMPDTTHWAFSVADTGQGISPEMHKLVFEPFRQAELPGDMQRKGVGLGLSVVSQFTAAMRGKVSLESEVGKGSMFIITLPVQDV